jgi:hypothetical protein
MSYSDFTLRKIKTELAINIVECKGLFANVIEVTPSNWLQTTLQYNAPIALAIGTEKARSEMIIVNVLLEIKKLLHDQVSIFSGINFDVDKEKGLNGFCDFIITKSPEQLCLNTPVISVVESKDDKTTSGLGQCIAELYAASIFNQQEQKPQICLYGIITTGSNWRFLKYENQTAFIDLDEYTIANLNAIIGIMIQMLR